MSKSCPAAGPAPRHPPGAPWPCLWCGRRCCQGPLEVCERCLRWYRRVAKGMPSSERRPPRP